MAKQLLSAATRCNSNSTYAYSNIPQSDRFMLMLHTSMQCLHAKNETCALIIFFMVSSVLCFLQASKGKALNSGTYKTVNDQVSPLKGPYQSISDFSPLAENTNIFINIVVKL